MADKRPANRRDHRWAGHLRLDLEATGVRQDHIDRGEGEELTSEERARLRQLEAGDARLWSVIYSTNPAFWAEAVHTPRVGPVRGRRG
jgi:hypothetical protein